MLSTAVDACFPAVVAATPTSASDFLTRPTPASTPVVSAAKTICWVRSPAISVLVHMRERRAFHDAEVVKNVRPVGARYVSQPKDQRQDAVVEAGPPGHADTPLRAHGGENLHGALVVGPDFDIRIAAGHVLCGEPPRRFRGGDFRLMGHQGNGGLRQF